MDILLLVIACATALAIGTLAHKQKEPAQVKAVTFYDVTLTPEQVKAVIEAMRSL